MTRAGKRSDLHDSNGWSRECSLCDHKNWHQIGAHRTPFPLGNMRDNSTPHTSTCNCGGRIPRYLTEQERTAFLGFSRRKLSDLRYMGEGPRYRKRGRSVWYTDVDLEAWLDGGLVEPEE